MSGFLSPAAFSSDEFTPVHRNSLAYLQSRVEDAERQLDLVAHALQGGYAGEGAACMLELIIHSLAALRDEMQPDNLHIPAARNEEVRHAH